VHPPKIASSCAWAALCQLSPNRTRLLIFAGHYPCVEIRLSGSWAPSDCLEAKSELKKLVADEYLQAIRSALASPELARHFELMESVSNADLMAELQEILSDKFPGEEGYLDSLARYIDKHWSRNKKGAQRIRFVRTCELLFGDDDFTWYKVIFSAAIE
jgi:hypothetical protein